jgi:hypothetical protein
MPSKALVAWIPACEGVAKGVAPSPPAGEGWDEGYIKQGVSFFTPHPNPLPHGERGL